MYACAGNPFYEIFNLGRDDIISVTVESINCKGQRVEVCSISRQPAFCNFSVHTYYCTVTIVWHLVYIHA